MVSLTYFNENSIKYFVNDSKSTFRFIIPLNNNSNIPRFVANNFSSNSTENTLSLNGFQLKVKNVGVQIHIKPYNNRIGYFLALKFGSNPILNSTDLSNKTISKKFCPSGLKTEFNETFYTLFLNVSQINNYTGYIGFGIIEIDCFDHSLNYTYANNYSTRVILFSCNFLSDEKNGIYSSEGMTVLETSNLTHTHCLSNHLTQFAGGFITLPPAINFNDVFAKASFLDNITIYMTVIVSSLVYVILLIWSRYMDKKDAQKSSIKLMKDNCKNDVYFYEVLFYTGSSFESATDSTVSFFCQVL